MRGGAHWRLASSRKRKRMRMRMRMRMRRRILTRRRRRPRQRRRRGWGGACSTRSRWAPASTDAWRRARGLSRRRLPRQLQRRLRAGPHSQRLRPQRGRRRLLRCPRRRYALLTVCTALIKRRGTLADPPSNSTPGVSSRRWVGRCKLPVSNSMLRAPLVSAFETKMW